MINSVKQKKPSAIMLEMAKHPIPRKMFTVLGRRFLFAYPVSHLSLLAVIFGYTNIITEYRFGIYSSLITGDSVNFALCVYRKEFSNAFFILSVVLSHVVFGVSFDCYLLNTLKSREKAYSVISILLGLACIIVDFSLYNTDNGSRYIVLVLSGILGALAHWTCKLGYVTMCLRGNLLNWMESTYKFVTRYSQGGPKSKGDSFIVTTIITSFFIGIVLALIALANIREFSLIPVTFTVPLQLHLAGCFEVWRSSRIFDCLNCWSIKATESKEEINNQNRDRSQSKQIELKSINEMQDIKNILCENIDKLLKDDINKDDPDRLSRTSDVSSIHSRHHFSLRSSLALPILSLLNDSKDKDKGFTFFSSIELSPKELEEYEDLISSFGYKNDLLQTV